MNAFDDDEGDFTVSLEAPSDAELAARAAKEREEAAVEKIWQPPSTELMQVRRDFYGPITDRYIHSNPPVPP